MRSNMMQKRDRKCAIKGIATPADANYNDDQTVRDEFGIASRVFSSLLRSRAVITVSHSDRKLAMAVREFALRTIFAANKATKLLHSEI